MPVAGSSNQPSMPVRRRVRSERTNPSPIESHQLRSVDRSQASRVSSLAKRYSMCHTCDDSPARTHPEPRKPGYLFARFTPVCTHAVASAMCAGSTSRRIDTVIGSVAMPPSHRIGVSER